MLPHRHGDGFGFEVGLEAFFAEFAAEAGHLVIAKGRGGANLVTLKSVFTTSGDAGVCSSLKLLAGVWVTRIFSFSGDLSKW